MPKTAIGAGAESIASIFTTFTAFANVLGKNAAALDRASDASYGVADTLVKNQELRNQGSLKDTLLSEEIRDHERLAERVKFNRRRERFLEDFPDALELLDPPSKIIAKEPTQPVEAKPKTTKK